MVGALRTSRNFTRRFSLIELLIVIAILAVMMSLLMPALRKSSFYAKNMTCIFNLKAQALAYTLYCEDNDGIYPGIRSSDAKARTRLTNYDRSQYGGTNGFHNNDYEFRIQMAPYFDGGNKFSDGKYSLDDPVFECEIAGENQSFPSNPNYERNGKRFYFLYFNAIEPSNSVNVAQGYHYRTPEERHKVMHKLGDTWQWDRVDTNGNPGWNHGVRGLKFNVLASDRITVARNSNGIQSNHFWDAPDFQPGTNWGPDSPSKSAYGEVVLNVALDNGGTLTLRSYRQDMYQAGEDGWNCRGPGGDGGTAFALPRNLAVGQ